MTGGVWVASYVMLWLAVLGLGLAVVALLRQIGVLHARLQPMGVHFGGEGPDRLSPAPVVPGLDYAVSTVTLIGFTSTGCEVCARLRPGLAALDAQYDDVTLRLVEHGPTTGATFAAFKVRSTPYFVAVDRGGVVQSRGVANSLEQIEVMLAEVLQPVGGDTP